MEQMNRYESKQIQSKKQYIAALSLPIKEVAQALGHSQAKNPNQTHSLIDLKNKKTPMPQKNGKVNRSMQFNQYQYPDIKLPHTNLNHMKLKVVLKELKKD